MELKEMRQSILELLDDEDQLEEHLRCALADNPNYLTELHPELKGKTILYEAVKREKVAAVKVLLAAGADPREFSHKFQKYVMHVAAEKANCEIIGMLLEHMRQPTNEDVNVQELKKMRTPLHELLEKLRKNPDDTKTVDCLKFLLSYDPPLSFNVELKDATDQSVVAIATESPGMAWVVEEFIRRYQDTGTAMDEGTVNLIRERSETIVGTTAAPRTLQLIRNQKAVVEDSQDPDMWTILETGNEILFQKYAMERHWPDDYWNSSNGSMTFLQMACWEEHPAIVRDLLNLGANPNTATQRHPESPALIAAKAKNLNILKILAEWEDTVFTQRVTGPNGQYYNILHILLGWDVDLWAQNTDGLLSCESIAKSFKCLKFLLEDPRCLGPDKDSVVNEANLPRKDTPLHLATSFPCQAFNRLLLENGAERSLFLVNTHGFKPVSGILTETLREYLDSCVRFEKGPMDSEFRITFRTGVLLPRRADSKAGEVESLLQQESGFHSATEFCYKDNECRDGVPELAHLAAFREHNDLFDHPVIAGMIWTKWRHFHKHNHWVHFFLYLRILTLIVCLAYTYFTFGGIVSGSLFGYTFAQSDCLNEIAKLPDTTGAYSAIRAKGFIPFNCFYVYPSTILRVHLLVFASIAAVQILFRFAFLIRASARNTFGNLKALLRLGDFQVKIVIVCLAYALIVLDPTALTGTKPNFTACRDISGLLVIFCCFDFCFILRDFLPWRQVASMINWTLVVASTMFSFIAIHLFLFFGFGLAFYIQLHNDHTDNPHLRTATAGPANDTATDEEAGGNHFNGGIDLTLKVMAMFIGELEFGDHPFAEGNSFSYVVFGLFVFIIVIVIMNLLTTVAILDVTEIKNKSNDDSWFGLAMSMNYWEEGLMRLVPLNEYFRRLKRSLYVFSPDAVIVCYPNDRLGSVAKRPKRRSELIVTERHVVEDAKKICIERMRRVEEETLGEVAASSGQRGDTAAEVASMLAAVQRRLCHVESRMEAGTKSVRETQI